MAARPRQTIFTVIGACSGDCLGNAVTFGFSDSKVALQPRGQLVRFVEDREVVWCDPRFSQPTESSIAGQCVDADDDEIASRKEARSCDFTE